MAATNPIESSKRRAKYANIASWVIVCIIAFLFVFPLYWIITGSFKTKQEIMSTTPVWLPSVFTGANFEKLMSSRSAPLFDLKLFGYVITGPTVPAALRWLVNTVFMSVTSMLLTSGGPKNATMTIMYYIYYNAFKLYRYGYGNAMGVILAIVIAILSAVQFKAGQEK